MRNIISALTLAAALNLSAWCDPVSMEQLFANRKEFDGKVVTVSGTVKNYYEKDDFGSCLLIEGGKGCSLYLPSKPGLRNDSRVTVTGTFSLSKKINNRHFSNVVEATDVQNAP